ncbi:helix-turn-helix domain-containing protein [Streptomyces apocyni]|uniref:hypothetical protein n=1 Tax=Streptomyces apocyni TaxID=2654677 RepID=UPI0012EAF05E|nr:hypothetical protein [Streptomyces apocyni]
MLKHAISPTRFFSQTPNDIIRHPRLNGTAVRLLQWALSLPDGSRDTIPSIGEKMPEGRMAVRKARQQLEREGYLHTRRAQAPETGRWTTQVLVSNVALTTEDEIAAAFGGGCGRGGEQPPPSDRIPAAGEQDGQAVGASPKGEKMGGDTPNPTALDGALGRATAFLGRIGDRAPALRLGVPEIVRLAPLAAWWLELGATEADLRQALTADLPQPVRAPAALLSYRLTNRIPAPREPVQPLVECADCCGPLPRGQLTGLCAACAGVPSQSPDGGHSIAAAGAARVREALVRGGRVSVAAAFGASGA